MASSYIEQPVLDVPQFAGLMNDTWDVQPLPFRFSKAINMYLHGNALHTLHPVREAYLPNLDVGPVTVLQDYKENAYRTHLLAVDQAGNPVGPFFGTSRARFTNGSNDVMLMIVPPHINENWNQWVVPGCKIRSRDPITNAASNWFTITAVTGFHTGVGNRPHVTLSVNWVGVTGNYDYEITYPLRHTANPNTSADFGFRGATKMFESQGYLILLGKDIPICGYEALSGFALLRPTFMLALGSGQDAPVDHFRVLEWNDGSGVYDAISNAHALYRAPWAYGAFALRHAYTGCALNGLLLLGNTCEVMETITPNDAVTYPLWFGAGFTANAGSPLVTFGPLGGDLVLGGLRPGDLFFPPIHNGTLAPGVAQAVNFNKERYRIKTIEDAQHMTLDRDWAEDYNATTLNTVDWRLQKVQGDNFVRCCSLYNLHEWNGSGEGLGTYLIFDETPGEIVAMEGFGDTAIVFKKDAIHSVYKTNSVDLINERPLYTDLGSYGGFNAVARLPNACMFMHNLDFYVIGVDGGGAKKVDRGYRTYLEEHLLGPLAVIPQSLHIRAFGTYMPREECVMWFLQAFATPDGGLPLSHVELIYSLQSNQWTACDFNGPAANWIPMACGQTKQYFVRRTENIVAGGTTTTPPTAECSYIMGYDYRIYGSPLAYTHHTLPAYLESCIFDFGLQGKITEPIWAHFKWSGYDSSGVVAKPTFFLERSVEVDGSDLAQDVAGAVMTDINDTQQKGKGRAFRLRMEFPNEYDVFHGIRFRVTDIVEK